MEYENINWENREVARPRTYKMIQNADGTVTLTPAPGEVINKGTPLNRENLNHMDKGISDCAATANEATKLVKKLNTAIDQHINASSNPHKIDKEKVGLGNVPNVSTNEQTPTYTEATEDETLVSGEKLSTAFGKLARAVRSHWAHIANKENPHGVTKAQVGLGNVPNVSTDNQTVSYTEASSDANLASGEKLSVAFGKLARAVRSLWAHIANKANPHGVTKAQVGLGSVPNVSTNNQTPTYTEASSDANLASGETLAVAFGKLARAVRSLWAHIGNKENPHGVDFFQAYQQIFSEAYAAPDAEGSFVGDGNSTITINGFQRPGKIINLGFTPSRVLIVVLGAALEPGHHEGDIMSLEMAATMHNVRAVYFGTGKNYYHSGCPSGMNTAAPETLLNMNHGGAAVCENGFVIQYNRGMYVNEKGVQHIYRAWK